MTEQLTVPHGGDLAAALAASLDAARASISVSPEPPGTVFVNPRVFATPDARPTTGVNPAFSAPYASALTPPMPAPTDNSLEGPAPDPSDPAYTHLRDILAEAFAQSATGKGKERHANARPFHRQPIAEIGRMVGPGFNTGQVMKKTQEAMGMYRRGEHDRAVHELLGAIVYASAAVMLIREEQTP